MMVLPPVEGEFHRIIRNERAKDPLITVSGLEKVLEKRFNRGFSRRYVAKLADKIARRALVNANRMRIEEGLEAWASIETAARSVGVKRDVSSELLARPAASLVMPPAANQRHSASECAALWDRWHAGEPARQTHDRGKRVL